jgi:uncharacterized protein (DUF924 family)
VQRRTGARGVQLVGMSAENVIEFWFSETTKPLWFKSTTKFDMELKQIFLPVYQAAVAGQLTNWKYTPAGALALVILLDQIPLNIFRGEPASFATEHAAREFASCAIASGFDREYTSEQKVFLYMPFMHSENLNDQVRSVELYEKAGLSANLRYAQHHQEIIRRFGRFPHRNTILGRASTSEEQAYLNSKHAFLG